MPRFRPGVEALENRLMLTADCGCHPVATDDFYTAHQGHSITLDLLANDSGMRTPLSASILSGPSHGSLTSNSDGTFTYLPIAGADSLTYLAVNANNHDSLAARAIIVIMNDASASEHVTFSVLHDQTLTDTLSGQDADRDALTFSAGSVTNGSLTLHSDGTFESIPPAHWAGTVQLSYTVGDGAATINASATILVINTPPADTVQAVNIHHDTNVDSGIDLGFDGDGDSVSGTSSGAAGSVTVNGTASYNSPVNTAGGDSFTIHISEGISQGTSSVVVNLQDAPPIAGDMVIMMDWLSSAINPEAEPLDYTVYYPATDYDDALTYSGVTTDPSSSDSFIYMQAVDYTGESTYAYTVSDGVHTATGTIVIQVTHYPYTGDDIFTFGGAATIIHDTTFETIISGRDNTEGENPHLELVTPPEHGTLDFGTSQEAIPATSFNIIHYTPDEHFTGKDTFQFRTGDDTNDGPIATFYLTVYNTPPVVNSAAYSGPHDTPITGSLYVMDREDDSLTATVGDPGHGTVSFDISTGGFTYTPDESFVGFDQFTVTVNDGVSDSVASVLLLITCDTPIARIITNDPGGQADLSDTIDHNQTLTVSDDDSLLLFASDSEPLTAVLDSSTTQGSLSLGSDGSFTYTPNHDFVGQDSFTYHVTDGLTTSETVRVVIHVRSR